MMYAEQLDFWPLRYAEVGEVLPKGAILEEVTAWGIAYRVIT